MAATVFRVAGSATGQISNLRVETEMNWDRLEDKWTRIKGSAIEQWDDLTEDRLASRIQETYGNSDDEAEPELTDWQQRLSEIERDDAARRTA
jgi:uncharacterized protein YjbJ (UPF0337 family)